MFQYWRSGSFRACVLPASNHLPVLDVALQRRKFYLAWRNASLTCLCFDGPISARLGAARGVKQWLSHEPNRLLGNIDIIGLLFNNKTKPLLNCQVRVTGDQWFRTCFGAWWPITGEVKCQDLQRTQEVLTSLRRWRAISKTVFSIFQRSNLGGLSDFLQEFWLRCHIPFKWRLVCDKVITREVGMTKLMAFSSTKALRLKNDSSV